MVKFGKLYSKEDIQIGSTTIHTPPCVTSLGCTLDVELNMSMHATRVCQSANYYLHSIRKIRNCISLDICKLLVHTLVTVRLDYGIALLCGARYGVIRQLERVQKQAATVVCKKIKYDMHTSVTELLWGLHCLPIRACIQYNVVLLVYKAFTTSKPPYLSDMLASKKQVRATLSSLKVNILYIPKTIPNNGYTAKAFSVAGPRLWNSTLDDELRGCTNADLFKKKLKTLLFKSFY